MSCESHNEQEHIRINNEVFYFRSIVTLPMAAYLLRRKREKSVLKLVLSTEGRKEQLQNHTSSQPPV